MLKLIQNEWMKLWSKKATWIMLFMLIFIIVGMSALTKLMDGQPPMEDSQGNIQIENNKGDSKEMPKLTWQEEQQATIVEYDAQLKAGDLSKQAKDQLIADKNVAQYRLDHNLKPEDKMTRENFIIDAHGMTSLVTLFAVIIAAGIVAIEFSQGTIKMLLTRPVSRLKVLTSKYVTVLLFGVVMAFVAWLMTVICGFVLFDASGVDYLKWTGSKVVEQSYWVRSIYLMVLAFTNVFVTATFAFMIGSVFRSNALAIGIAMFLWLMGDTIVMFIRKYEIAKYLFFTHTDLTQYETGFRLVDDITMPFSIAVLAVYVIVFLVVSFGVFMKRDVTA